MEGQVKLIIASSLEEADLPVDLKKPGTDVRHVDKEQIGIADARSLIEQSSRTSLSSGVYSFIVTTKSITGEAQNALLKLLEEPPINTSIYLIIPHESLLMPTLRSRFVMVEKSGKGESDGAVEAEVFLSSTLAERLHLIAEKAKQKDTIWLERMVMNLGKLVSISPRVSDAPVYRALALTESYIGIRGASRKMLLEELALSMPVKAK